jgi:Lipopolysaccharide-assembly
MVLNKKLKIVVVGVLGILLMACTVSYKFNGSSIDYTKIHTIAIADFPNRAGLIYPPLSSYFSETLRDVYSRQTALKILKRSGDLQVEGEIVEYVTTPGAPSKDGPANQYKLTMTVNVRFTNVKNPDEDFEKKFSAFQTYVPSSWPGVQSDLMKLLVDEITDKIFNETVARW